jgi:riboflavin kinase, archaea type
MKPYLLSTLKELGLLGAIERKIELSSQELAHRMGISQQTASRYLLELDQAQLIIRELGVKRQILSITPTGRDALEAEFLSYQQIFTLSSQVVFTGTLISGLGEGKYYTAHPGYQKQFEEKLGFIPYPGTLNVEIAGIERNKIRLLAADGIPIAAFNSDDRTFGAVICFKATVNGEPAAVVLPKRSHYAAVLELISPYQLREKLHLKDGDTVTVTVSLTGGHTTPL